MSIWRRWNIRPSSALTSASSGFNMENWGSVFEMCMSKWSWFKYGVVVIVCLLVLQSVSKKFQSLVGGTTSQLS